MHEPTLDAERGRLAGDQSRRVTVPLGLVSRVDDVRRAEPAGLGEVVSQHVRELLVG